MAVYRLFCCRFSQTLTFLQIILGFFVIFASLTSLHRFYSLGLLDSPRTLQTIKEGYTDFDLNSLSDRFEELLTRLSDLQDKLESTIHSINQNKTGITQIITKSEFKRYLEEVIQPLYSALIRIPRQESMPMEDPLINFFTVEETREYITSKGNRGRKLSIYGTNKTYGTLGHACVLTRIQRGDLPSAPGALNWRRRRGKK